MNLIGINQAVANIKELIENAIRTGGVEGKNNLIRTQTPICILHDAAKSELINKGVNPRYIHPILGDHNGEQKLAGFFKCKDQDICVFPNNKYPHREVLNFDGILKGQIDKFGFDFTQSVLSINVRSQLSSVAKNFDTLYERTFAEALNLHLRCEKMVLGEFYMIPVFEYDDALAKDNIVGFKRNSHIQDHIQKYLYSFNAVNNRPTDNGEEYKYERVCLLVVDFSKQTPKIYNTNAELIADGLLPRNSSATIDNMNFSTFIDTLLDIYSSRFGNGKFI